MSAAPRVEDQDPPPVMRAKPTRGKTKPGRLDALDHAILRIDPPKPGPFPLAWDLGFGAHPNTSLDWSQALRRGGWNAQVLGLEAHPGRAAYARRYNSETCRFDLVHATQPAPWNRKPRWIRAMNVLRQYRAEHCEAWHERWASSLVNDGHLFEGTCSADGSVLVAHWITPKPEGHLRRGLLFHTNFSQGFAPLLFGDRLPKDLRAHARQTGAIGDFLRRWTRAWKPCRGLPLLESFTQSVRNMDPSGQELCVWTNAQGATLLWAPRSGIPRQTP